MQLYHVSIASRALSIQDQGLLVSYAEMAGGKRRMYFCSKTMITWAVRHVRTRHGVPLSEIVIVRVELPRSAVQRHRNGLWYTWRDVPPGHIREISAIWDQAGLWKDWEYTS
jgi:hypothetical protein